MIEYEHVKLNGRIYVWAFSTFSSDIESLDLSWGWDDIHNMPVPPAIVEQLNAQFLAGHAAEVLARLDSFSFPHFHEVLIDMGATTGQIDSMCNDASERAYDEYIGHDRYDCQPGPFDEDDMECECDIDDASQPESEMPPVAFNPFNCEVIRDWFFMTPRFHWNGDIVGYIGNGPFAVTDVDTLLRRHKLVGIDLSHSEPSPNISVIVLGREGWIEEEVDALIDERVGGRLRFYSQEMLLAYLATRTDPLAARSDVLEAFKAGHPGLEYVAEGWQGWVTTQVNEDWRAKSTAVIDDSAWADESPLHALGYTVGISGEPTDVRRMILADAFNGQLPQRKSVEYMAQWGTPQSPARLKKIAKFIAWMCRRAKRQPGGYEQTIKDYEDDLLWLRQTFYHGHMRFSWPNTIV